MYDKFTDGADISAAELLELAEALPLSDLCAMADAVRTRFLGGFVDSCSIVNAKSGRCSENCKWCAQSAHYNTGCDIYGYISAEKARECAASAKVRGIRRFSLVTSGRGLSDEGVAKMSAAFEAMREVEGISLCGSFGLLNEGQFRALAAAGMTRYHCNLETAPSKFPELCTTHSIADKLESINAASRAGLSICSGGIIGMGETFEQRVELAFALREIAADSIPINILNPIKNTPLEHVKPISTDEILAAYAVFRLANPRAHIRFAGGRQMISGFEERALKSGVSAVLMGDFLTTVGAKVADDFALLKRLGYDY